MPIKVDLTNRIIASAKLISAIKENGDHVEEGMVLETMVSILCPVAFTNSGFASILKELAKLSGRIVQTFWENDDPRFTPDDYAQSLAWLLESVNGNLDFAEKIHAINQINDKAFIDFITSVACTYRSFLSEDMADTSVSKETLLEVLG